MNLLLGLAAAAAAIVLLTYFLIDLLMAKRAKARTMRNLQEFETVTVKTVRERELAIPMRERVVQPGLRRVAAFAQTFTPVGVVSRLDETLVHAGITTWDGPRLLAVKLLSTGAGAFFGLTVLPWVLNAAGQPVAKTAPITGVFAPVLAIIGYYLPEWIVRGKAEERSKELQRSLPDALDLLSISVTAGLGFEAALDRVSREMRGSLGVELYRVVQEMRLGQGRGDALRALSDRTNVPELDSFITAMVQAEQFGVPIASVLNTQAAEMRIKRRQRAEEAAQKIPVKILFPLIVCIFPTLFIVILGPPGIRIAENILK